jgi:hypothetical protein
VVGLIALLAPHRAALSPSVALLFLVPVVAARQRERAACRAVEAALLAGATAERVSPLPTTGVGACLPTLVLGCVYRCCCGFPNTS